MAELDVIEITNPTSEDFTHNYNGEPYTVKAGETKILLKYIAFHLAKHLSTKVIQDKLKKGMTKKDKENPNARIHREIAQTAVYDTPARRIALYTMLKNVDLVLDVIKVYPFKGFIGEMKDYEDFVTKTESKKKPEKVETTN